MNTHSLKLLKCTSILSNDGIQLYYNIQFSANTNNRNLEVPKIDIINALIIIGL